MLNKTFIDDIYLWGSKLTGLIFFTQIQLFLTSTHYYSVRRYKKNFEIKYLSKPLLLFYSTFCRVIPCFSNDIRKSPGINQFVLNPSLFSILLLFNYS